MAVGKAINSFTSAVAGNEMNAEGDFNISLDFTTGSGVGTVALERSFDGGVTWKKVKEYTADAEEVGNSAGSLLHRLNCTAFTSGTIAAEINY